MTTGGSHKYCKNINCALIMAQDEVEWQLKLWSCICVLNLMAALPVVGSPSHQRTPGILKVFQRGFFFLFQSSPCP